MQSSLGLKLLVFDLDGTLADTRLDIAHSTNATLSQLGKSALSVETIVSFVGDGVDDLLRLCLRAVGCGKDAIEALLPSALERFLAHYQEHCTDFSLPYPGAMDLLNGFSGFRKAILSNKPLAPALRLLDHLGMRRHFDLVLGGDNPHGKKPNPAGLGYILSALEADPGEAILIGDSLQDLRTAEAGGCGFIAFMAGMGNREALENGNPAHRVSHLGEIPGVIAGMARKAAEKHG